MNVSGFFQIVPTQLIYDVMEHYEQFLIYSNTFNKEQFFNH